jgi:hypothetical protein
MIFNVCYLKIQSSLKPCYTSILFKYLKLLFKKNQQ